MYKSTFRLDPQISMSSGFLQKDYDDVKVVVRSNVGTSNFTYNFGCWSKLGDVSPDKQLTIVKIIMFRYHSYNMSTKKFISF